MKRYIGIFFVGFLALSFYLCRFMIDEDSEHSDDHIRSSYLPFIIQEDTVRIFFEAGYENDSAILSLNDSVIYASNLTTDWSLGYSDCVPINRRLYKKGKLKLYIRNKIIPIQSIDTIRNINISINEKDDLFIQYTNREPLYD